MWSTTSEYRAALRGNERYCGCASRHEMPNAVRTIEMMPVDMSSICPARISLSVIVELAFALNE